jgi:hypothetical protein
MPPVVGRGLSWGGQGRRDWVKKTLGWSVELVERAKKPAPEEVLMAWAREWAKEGGVAVDWQKLMPPKGFLVLPRRWVVENYRKHLANSKRSTPLSESRARNLSSPVFVF